MSRYSHLVASFKQAVLSSPAKLSPATRQAVYAGGSASPETDAYLAKVRRHAYKITDEDVARLRAAGWDDESIYELTVAAALGEGMRRLDIGLQALREAQGK